MELIRRATEVLKAGLGAEWVAEDCWRIDDHFTESDLHEVLCDVLIALREPSEAMVRSTVVQTDHTADHLDFGAAVIEGMPALRPDRQRDGIVAAADVYRDWQHMIDAALIEVPVQ